MFAKRSETKKGARRRVSRVLSRPSKLIGAVMAIPLGRSLPSASCDRPERRREGSPGTSGFPGMPAAPTWSCSRWGFPCRRRHRQRGALLPHRFTLAARSVFPRQAGGVLSVALSLGSPPPGVTRHRTSVEPGLSSPRQRRRAAIRPSGTTGFGYPQRSCQRSEAKPRWACERNHAVECRRRSGRRPLLGLRSRDGP